MRCTAAVVFALGAAAAIAGYLPAGALVTSDHGTHYEWAGGHGFAAFLALLLGPGVGVLLRPSRARILLWLVWSIPCVAALLSLSIGAEPLWHAHDGRATPLWPAWLTYLFAAATVCGVIIAVPAVGLGDRRSNLPAARLRRA